jgi:hypothetical protein
MPLYDVQRPMRYRGRLYSSGCIELAEQDAAHLVAIGVLAPSGQPQGTVFSGQPQEAAPTSPVIPAQAGTDPRVGVVVQMLIDDPEQLDDALWTKAKAPELPELNRRLAEQGMDKVSAKERDALWAEARTSA